MPVLPSPRDGQHRRPLGDRVPAGCRHSTAELQGGKPGPTARSQRTPDAPPVDAETRQSLQELALQRSREERFLLDVQQVLRGLPGLSDQATCRATAGPTGWLPGYTSRG